MQFLFDYDNVVATRSRTLDFLGASLIVCMSKHAPHPLLRGEDQADLEDEGDSRLLAMLQLEMEEACEAAQQPWQESLAQGDGPSSESGASSSSTKGDDRYI